MRAPAALVLTHMSDELDADWARQEAERSFGGPVDVAHEGAVYDRHPHASVLPPVKSR